MKSVYTAEYEELMEALATARKARGLTQAQLATTLGKPQSYVAKVEGCERRLDIIEFFTTCQAIGVDAVEILASSGLIQQGEGSQSSPAEKLEH